MAYYLKWSGDSGNVNSNNELLQISGITGNLASIQYTLKEDIPAYGSNRYLFDIRRLENSTNNGGDTGWFFQGTNGVVFISRVSNTLINELAVSESDFFTAQAEDVCKFTVNRTPSGGTVSFGGRFNEIEHLYGLAVSEIIIVDAAGTHTLNMSSSNGTGTGIVSDTGNLTADLLNFPTDDSQWVFYDDGGGATGVTSDVTFTVNAPTASASASVAATLPQPSGNVAFTVNAPSVTANASATIPGYNASISFTVNAPSVSADASATLPDPSAGISYTVSTPSISADLTASLPQPDSGIAFTVNTPSVNATASATQTGWNADVNFTVNAPSVSISASATLPQPESAVSFTVSPPQVAVVAIVGGIAIIVDDETNINQRALSNNINAPILSNNING